MPRFPWSARRDGSALEDTALAALLEGSELPADAAAQLRPVADMLAALRTGPASDELTGLAAAQAEFRRIVRPARPHRSRRLRPARLASLLGAKAAAAAIVAIGLGGAGAAAYAGALPASWQQFAHRTIGAPAPRPANSGTRARPNHAGRPAHGECTAYRHGTAAEKGTVLRDLVKAAGGAGNVAKYCTAVPRAGSAPARPHPAGRVTTHPAKGPSDRRPKRPTGPPAGHASGPPSARRSGIRPGPKPAAGRTAASTGWPV
jgi:hypothetical protein